MTKVQIGSISTGTLRDRDLLPTFLAELDALDSADSTRFAEARALADRLESENEDSILDWEYSDDADRDEVAYLINEVLPDALNEYAPPHTYFGTLEGDGADFGFWPTGEAWGDTCEMHVIEESQGSGTYLDLTCHLYVTQSDHGNVSVYQIDAGEEIWSAV